MPDARCGVRGAWYEVRGARYEAQDTRYVVRGAGYTCWVCWEGTCKEGKDGNDVHNMHCKSLVLTFHLNVPYIVPNVH